MRPHPNSTNAELAVAPHCEFRRPTYWMLGLPTRCDDSLEFSIKP
ncbi:hypothetical protein OQ519_27235 [Pseudomonas lurida]|nr:hypothetical protein [Pseudomonas lurida]UZQ74562.1 hypothetical protein OQ519_27235 [Pseudomonas lurida]